MVVVACKRIKRLVRRKKRNAILTVSSSDTSTSPNKYLAYNANDRDSTYINNVTIFIVHRLTCLLLLSCCRRPPADARVSDARRTQRSCMAALLWWCCFLISAAVALPRYAFGNGRSTGANPVACQLLKHVPHREGVHGI